MLGRLIPLAGGDPAENMAIDQALLESTSRSRVPTLRLYRWNRPTLSLGYFQQLSDRAFHPASLAIDCVRRSTGGGAIVHHHELTYSLAVPVAPTAGPQFELYTRIHGEIASMLRDFGVLAAPFRTLARSAGEQISTPFLCFQRRTDEDLIVCGYKVLGSAQRKTRGAVLQHGSLLLKASPWAPELPGVAELSSRCLSETQVAEELTQRLARNLSVQWQADELTPAEGAAVSRISESKFGSPHWHQRR